MIVKVEVLSTFHRCKHPLIGEVISGCDEYSAELYPGINFLFGDVFANGWACTYAISKGSRSGFFEGNFFVDNELISLNELRKLTYYVAYNEKKYLKKIKLNTALNMCKDWSNIKDDVCKQFKLRDIDEDGYLMGRRFEQLSHSIYLCSCLLGIAKGKKIFCFPWLSESETLLQTYRFSLLSEYALKNDLIIIIPTPLFFNRKKEYPYKLVIG